MSTLLRSFYRSLYHTAPVSGVMLTAGVVDAILGGSNDSPGLFSVGLGIVGVGLAMRWVRWQKRPMDPVTPPVYYLPERSSRFALPPLHRKMDGRS